MKFQKTNSEELQRQIKILKETVKVLQEQLMNFDQVTYIVHVVAWCNGNKRQAAKQLGCCIKTVYNYIERFEKLKGCSYEDYFVPGEVVQPINRSLSFKSKS